MVSRKRALVISGGGSYSDPWHPFAVTSAALLGALDRAGVEGSLDDDVEAALAGLIDPAARPDLVVINIGNAGGSTPTEGAREGLLSSLHSGLPLLVLHSSSTAFPDWDEWERIVGGRWVRGTTFHPPQGINTVYPLVTEITEGLDPFEADDEMYTDLRVGEGVTIIAEYTDGDRRHPLAWAVEHGGARVVYDALGHDGRSYESVGRLALLDREIGWLLRR